MTVFRAFFLGMLFSLTAFAQGYPSRPVTFIVPWPPGGSTDLAMRSLAVIAEKHLGQRIVIENKPGVSGTMGAQALAQGARPDGYTIAQMPITVFRLPYMTKTNFDPATDFTWIIHLTGYTFGVVVRADSPWKTWADLIAHAKANPGKVTYATPGNGTSLHITMEDIAQRESIQWVQVPYKGYAEGAVALLGGHVDVHADSTGWAEQVNAGRLRLLVTWGAQRTKRWPEVPTLKDLGYPIVSNSPYGLAGPKGMDPAAVKALHDAFKKALEDPEYQKTLEKFDQESFYLSSEDYAALAKKSIEEERTAVKRLNLKM
ncbi:MAG TPA: tripartite tricarboxylate transporter substrate binding protein [Burkholderiales bacterium]|nr:tripartite tricarboxylate transporter substrate binding protein [Burkholderiales bacterium]